MLEIINEIDVWLLFLINVDFSNSFLDFLMPLITSKKSWYPVWLIVIAGFLWKGGREGRLLILFVIPLILLSDQLSAGILKPLIGRVRPCNVFENINVMARCTKAASMPSAHAANFFALASYFGYYFRKYRWYLFGIAGLVAISRVYVGVHYPFDVLAGAGLGIFCGWFTVILRLQAESFWNNKLNSAGKK